MSQPDTVILLVVIATAIALITRRVPVPYTVALVVAGTVLGAFHFVAAPHLTKPLLFAVFLPGLLFEAAFHLEWSDLRKNAGVITALAVPGVIASIGVTAGVLMLLARVAGANVTPGWREALVFGAVVAATDPIAVVSLVRSLGAPKRLGVLLEAESLLNDGTAIVLLGLVLTVATGTAASGVALVLDFLRIVGLGVAVGLLAGAAASLLARTVDDAVIEITLTVIAAYGSFVVADQLGGSGVIATVVAGVICGNYGARSAMSPATRLAAQSFWDYVAFLLNSIVFLLIGFEVHLPALIPRWPLIVASLVAGWVSRSVVVSLVVAGAARTPERIPREWTAPLIWGGLRGALSMVLALSLPDGVTNRELIIAMTVGFVLLSILLQGTTMARLLKCAGLAADPA
jgi:CPA1 family monovalent cation:H+ antiporter